MSRRKKKKHQGRKKTKEKRTAPFADERPQLFGLLLLAFTALLFFSMVSFAFGQHSHNLVGAIGYSIGWVFHASLGITGYFVCLFLAWIGWRSLFEKEINHLETRVLSFLVFIPSLAILLSLIEVQFPLLGDALSRFFYPPAARYPIPYHLGGLPFHYLYLELPTLNIHRVLNTLGTLTIFSLILFASLLAFFRIQLSAVTQWLAKWKPKRKEAQEEPQRYVKLRIPTERKETIDAEASLLAIEPETEFITRPSLSRKYLSDKRITTPTILDEVKKSEEPETKRARALKEQSVHNGDFTHYKLPSHTFLTPPKKVDQTELKRDLRRQAEVLEETLLSFGIEAKVGQINCGPTITSFEVHPSIGVKVQKIKALENDIALNMEATSIRIIAPIPGKAAVGIEIPNPYPQEVSFREMLSAYQRGTKKFRIPLLLGKAVNGDFVMSDLTKMPHCIVAGATGSGKSVCINTIVMSILYAAKPDEIQLLMVDPKKVELTPYSKLPHMIAPVITEPQEAYTAMQWLVKEMEKRYDILNKLHCRNIETFNSREIDKEKEESFKLEIPEKLPYIVGIIDELADLMMSSNYDIETPIARIAQMARAVGIHLILATQRPSREVITGLIKANFPTRICFKVSSGINSKIVIDTGGSEQLLGNGDMLFLPPGTSNLVRVQGSFIRDRDIVQVIDHICQQAPPNYRIPTFSNMLEFGEIAPTHANITEKDPLYKQALDIVLSTGNASTTFLQRKLKIGYARAASLMDELEIEGVVSEPDGSKARTVLLGAKD